MAKNQLYHEGNVPGVSNLWASTKLHRMEGPGLIEENVMKEILKRCGTNSAGTTDIHMQKNEGGPLPYTIHKN